jgi:hypothetical protein
MPSVKKAAVSLARKVLDLEIKRRKHRNEIPNEAIGLQKEVIFVAVPKTGTTSVRSQIREPGKPLIYNPHLSITQLREVLYVFFLQQSLKRNNRFPTNGHKNDLDIRAQANEAFDRFFKFSAVRNPWARAVSLYSRREGVSVREDLTFEQFCERHRNASDTCVHPTFHKNQCDWHCDENGVNLLDYVYRLEDFPRAIEEIRERTNGRIQLIDLKRNKNPGSKSMNYRSMYTDRTRKLIAKHFEKDIDTFKYTF